MPGIKKANPLLFLYIIVFSLYYWASIPAVPFHPDESTQIFTSADVDDFMMNPQSLVWQAAQKEDLRQHYRELDAPLTRYAIGLGRKLAQYQPLPSDWDWTKTWEENVSAGAFPSKDLLSLARFSVAIFFPLTLWFIFNIGNAIRNPTSGWIAIIALSTNALVLLHTRRAMAESILLFSITFFLWMMICKPTMNWQLAFPAALAFNAKQSSAALLITGIITTIWSAQKSILWRQKGLRALWYILATVGIVILLNPFLWRHPYLAAMDTVNKRQELVNAQTSMIREVSPDHTLDSLPRRAVVMIYQLFIAEPATADVANYVAQTDQEDMRYRKNPFNHLFRGLLAGGINLIFSLFGFLLMLKAALWPKHEIDSRFQLLILTTALLLASLILAVSLPFQRYVIPLIPFSCLFFSYGAASLLDKLPTKTRPIIKS